VPDLHLCAPPFEILLAEDDPVAQPLIPRKIYRYLVGDQVLEEADGRIGRLFRAYEVFGA